MAGAVRLQGFRSPLARSTTCLLYVARFTGYHRARHSTNRGQNSKWQGAALVAVRTHPMRALANARVAPCRGCALGRSTTCPVAVPLPFGSLMWRGRCGYRGSARRWLAPPPAYSMSPVSRATTAPATSRWSKINNKSHEKKISMYPRRRATTGINTILARETGGTV